MLKIFKFIVKTEKRNGKRCFTTRTPGWGVSLGSYIFMDKAYDETDWHHEFGHSVQSLYFGPLYLPIIGFASAICNNL
ncbi:MAG: hypothetical protein LBU66_04890 [Treponema sp.]|nr:hypothetical protein [Treponema sp.]